LSFFFLKTFAIAMFMKSPREKKFVAFFGPCDLIFIWLEKYAQTKIYSGACRLKGPVQEKHPEGSGCFSKAIV